MLLLFNIVVNREGVVFFFNFWDCYNFDLFNHILIRIIKAINCLDVVFGHDILRTLRCIDASSVDHTDAAPVIKRFFIVQKQDTGRNSGGVEDTACQRDDSFQFVRFYKVSSDFTFSATSEQHPLGKNNGAPSCFRIHGLNHML